MKKLLFESETCSRCHGSGNYSYCADYGTRCFKCAGAGVTLTKRGEAAQRYLDSLRQKRIGDLPPGEKYRNTRMTHGGKMFTVVETVVSLEPAGTGKSGRMENGEWIYTEYQMITVRTTHAKYGESGLTCSPDTMVTVFSSDDAQKKQQALDYQATLTKQGKVSKKRERKAA